MTLATPLLPQRLAPVLLAALGVLVGSQALADEPTTPAAHSEGVGTKEWRLYIMTWAAKLSGYSLPYSLPQVQWEPESWFSHRACKDRTPCPVFGLYEDGDVVYLRGDLTDSAKDHVAVHEFVHYLQRESGHFDLRSCLDTDTREQEAFRVQSRFVAEVQNGFTRFGINHLACGSES